MARLRRTRLYVAPLGLWLTLDAGNLVRVELDSHTGAVRLGLAAANQFTPTALLRIEQPARTKTAGSYQPVKSFESERGAFRVPLGGETTWVETG